VKLPVDDEPAPPARRLSEPRQLARPRASEERGGEKSVDGVFFASTDFCPHRGESLGSGSLKGFVITCPKHGWKFDIETGECFSNPDGKLQTFPVSIDGDDVYVELE